MRMDAVFVVPAAGPGRGTSRCAFVGRSPSAAPGLLASTVFSARSTTQDPDSDDPAPR
ncbi:hypothetical protein [Motilibacter deserti]|uniref:Uncharacterized protein n=1 Tax=Motilibacter deserti TaxID=2714956 RepID=A0ABX0GSS5_9ACTN|nr:hypothetical protein [Motilibacter deserti]NHC13931.1 hypothetical protein [Motilibacter deserti]